MQRRLRARLFEDIRMWLPDSSILVVQAVQFQRLRFLEAIYRGDGGTLT